MERIFVRDVRRARKETGLTQCAVGYWASTDGRADAALAVAYHRVMGTREGRRLADFVATHSVSAWKIVFFCDWEPTCRCGFRKKMKDRLAQILNTDPDYIFGFHFGYHTHPYFNRITNPKRVFCPRTASKEARKLGRTFHQGFLDGRRVAKAGL
jgi:hypothetical protein